MSETENQPIEEKQENPEPVTVENPEPTPEEPAEEVQPPKEEGNAQGSDEEGKEEEGGSDASPSDGAMGEDGNMQPKKKKTKRYRKVKHVAPSFDLNNMYHLKSNDYNALKDAHLQSFFVNSRVRKQLEGNNLITPEGYIIERPDEYARNKKLLKEHYANSSADKNIKKKKKKATKGVGKEKHEEFIEEIKRQYK